MSAFDRPPREGSARRAPARAELRDRIGRCRAWIVIALLSSILAGCGGIPGPGRPTPIADRPISLNGRCMQTEEDGYRENAVLQVRDNEVQALSWQLFVGKRGSCRFEQSDFQQTKRRPHIELMARDGGGCKLMIWQDQRRITLAHAGCERRCTGGIYDQAWPVMFDPASGACAQNAR
jgi:hypothetical protein